MLAPIMTAQACSTTDLHKARNVGMRGFIALQLHPTATTSISSFKDILQSSRLPDARDRLRHNEMNRLWQIIWAIWLLPYSAGAQAQRWSVAASAPGCSHRQRQLLCPRHRINQYPNWPRYAPR